LKLTRKELRKAEIKHLEILTKMMEKQVSGRDDSVKIGEENERKTVSESSSEEN
jgi:uncharacterized protein YqeY